MEVLWGSDPVVENDLVQICVFGRIDVVLLT